MVQILALSGVGALAVAAWALRDYRAWRNLGVGGLPASLRGWLQTTLWRLAKTNPTSLEPLKDRMGGDDDLVTLMALPDRPGKRPQIDPHPVPHRQLSQHAPETVKAALRMAFDARVAADGERLFYARSNFEKHNRAVTLRPGCCNGGDATATHGEIAHIHPFDGSMHMVLSPSDTAIVIERGWGERHGLAGRRLGLPLTYTLIYAPRDQAEVEVAAQILDGAIAYMVLDRNPRETVDASLGAGDVALGAPERYA